MNNTTVFTYPYGCIARPIYSSGCIVCATHQMISHITLFQWIVGISSHPFWALGCKGCHLPLHRGHVPHSYLRGIEDFSQSTAACTELRGATRGIAQFPEHLQIICIHRKRNGVPSMRDATPNFIHWSKCLNWDVDSHSLCCTHNLYMISTAEGSHLPALLQVNAPSNFEEALTTSKRGVLCMERETIRINDIHLDKKATCQGRTPSSAPALMLSWEASGPPSCPISLIDSVWQP